MSFIVAFLNRLTHSDREATKVLFKYILYVKKLEKYYLGFEEIGGIFSGLVRMKCPEVEGIEGFSRWYCIDKLLTMFTHKIETEWFGNLARIWDRVIKGNIYFILEVIVAMIKKSKPQTLQELS